MTTWAPCRSLWQRSPWPPFFNLGHQSLPNQRKPVGLRSIRHVFEGDACFVFRSFLLDAIAIAFAQCRISLVYLFDHKGNRRNWTDAKGGKIRCLLHALNCVTVIFRSLIPYIIFTEATSKPKIFLSTFGYQLKEWYMTRRVTTSKGTTKVPLFLKHDHQCFS